MEKMLEFGKHITLPDQRREWKSAGSTKFSKNILNKFTNRTVVTYCENSSIMGLEFLVDKQRPTFDKFLWITGLSLAFGVCILLVIQSWNQWRSSTVLVQHAITDLPFPAITFCPDNIFKINISFLENMNKDNINGDNAKILNDLSLVCKGIQSYNINELIKINSSTTITNIEKYSYEANDLLDKVHWMLSEHKAETVFQPIITDIGICFTFNSLPRSILFKSNTLHWNRKYLRFTYSGREIQRVEWSVEKGYDRNVREKAYPVVALSVGKRSALRFTINRLPEHTEENICGSTNGFTIALHSPADIARPSLNGVRIQRGSAVDIMVTPEAVWTDDDVRVAYAPEERQCFYPKERYLSFFEQYTQSNCELECLANFTLHLCGCVGFYMPQYMSSKLCSSNDTQCMEYAKWKMYSVESSKESSIEDKVSRYIQHKTVEGLWGMRCNCLLTCNHITYQKSILPSNISSNKHAAEVSVYFVDTHYNPLRRINAFGTIDLLANFGGLLGLCLGVSMLTLIEIIYWLIVRPSFAREIKPVKKQISSEKSGDNRNHSNNKINPYPLCTPIS